MKVLIIENEKPAAEKISRLLKKIDKNIIIVSVIETVEGTINWIQENPEPDLILMDIQLDDGLCFEIFETIHLEIPVIFTTAYDDYTLKAFKVNSVDYLLKPVEEAPLSIAINKFKNVYFNKSYRAFDYQQLNSGFAAGYKSRFLVKAGIRYKSILVSQISHFHICERNVFLKTFQGIDYGIDYSLEKLQGIIDPDIFFRINRNCIVSIHVITEMLSYSSSRLELVIKNEDRTELFVVSRDKVSEFKRWIDK